MAVTYTFADRRSPVDASELDTNFSDLDTLKAPKASPTFTGTVTLSGGQIAFPATQNSSADANTLDDYEEGTFTPVILPLAGTVNTVSGSGRYTKIGDRVLGRVQITMTDAGTGSSGLQFSVPFGFTSDGGANSSTCYGREYTAVGYGIIGIANGASTYVIFKYDGTTTLITSGHTYCVNFHFAS